MLKKIPEENFFVARHFDPALEICVVKTVSRVRNLTPTTSAKCDKFINFKRGQISHPAYQFEIGNL
jgi:hypothetical protein